MGSDARAHPDLPLWVGRSQVQILSPRLVRLEREGRETGRPRSNVPRRTAQKCEAHHRESRARTAGREQVGSRGRRAWGAEDRGGPVAGAPTRIAS